MVATGIRGVRSCCLRDVTSDGACIRLFGLNIVPSEFGISFDDSRTERRCRLVWRDGDFVGAVFKNWQLRSTILQRLA
jgi:hypothetical protein